MDNLEIRSNTEIIKKDSDDNSLGNIQINQSIYFQ